MDAEASFAALAVLRTFRGKLAYAAEVDPQGLEQMNILIDSRPPDGGGAIGGDDLALTPAHLDVVNRALASGGEAPIAIESLPPAEWRSETETGRSLETVGRLMPRTNAAIERIVARVHGRSRAPFVGVEASASATPSPPGGAVGWLIPAGMMAGAVLLIKGKLEPMMVKHNKSMRALSARKRREG